MGYLYIAGTVLFTVYGQLVLKWRIVNYGAMPEDFGSKLVFLFKLLFDPYIFSGFAAAFVASFFWMAAMTKLELSFAYPFMSAAFVLVFLFSVFLFQEAVNWQKIVGLAFIVLGIIISSRGAEIGIKRL